MMIVGYHRWQPVICADCRLLAKLSEAMDAARVCFHIWSSVCIGYVVDRPH